jgi:hypothetical protein
MHHIVYYPHNIGVNKQMMSILTDMALGVQSIMMNVSFTGNNISTSIHLLGTLISILLTFAQQEG